MEPNQRDIDKILEAMDEGKLLFEGVTDFEEELREGWGILERNPKGEPTLVERYCVGPFTLKYSIK